VAVGGLASDALGASRIGEGGFASLTRVRAQSVLVRAESIERARQLLWDDMRLVVEPGGAKALAALLQGAISRQPVSTLQWWFAAPTPTQRT
jgi:threonine dehydratase